MKMKISTILVMLFAYQFWYVIAKPTIQFWAHLPHCVCIWNYGCNIYMHSECVYLFPEFGRSCWFRTCCKNWSRRCSP